MESTPSPLALKNVINEIKNACPDVLHTFIFQENQILAQDQNTPQQMIAQTQTALIPLAVKALVIGGLKSATFQGASKRVNITFLNNFYLTTVTPTQSDQKIVNNLTRVTIPAMLKLLQENPTTSTSDFTQENGISAPKTLPPVELTDEPEPRIPAIHSLSVTVENMGLTGRIVENMGLTGRIVENMGLTGRIVENMGLTGRFGNQDIIRLDPIIMAQWNEQYGYNKVQEITIEDSATGKSHKFKILPIKEQKYEGKNVIQLLEKTQQDLQAPKGTTLTIKPVVENSDAADLFTQEIPNESETPTEANTSSSVSSAPVSQFMVENLNGRVSGFLGADVARVDSAIIARWNELFSEMKIQEITVEDTVTGKKLTCKFKPIKDSNLEGKGVIQLSERLQSELQTKKGALVLVKPIIEQWRHDPW